MKREQSLKLVTKQILTQASWIILMAVILGFAVNRFHTKRVKISTTRPPLEYATDTVFAQTLPEATITINQQNNSDTHQITEQPLIISTEKLNQMIAKNQAVLIDARSKEEFNQSHLPHAQNIPMENFLE